MRDTGTSIFSYVPEIFIANITGIVVNQKCFKPLFQLIRSSIKIIKFDHVQFPANISSEDGV